MKNEGLKNQNSDKPQPFNFSVYMFSYRSIILNNDLMIQDTDFLNFNKVYVQLKHLIKS